MKKNKTVLTRLPKAQQGMPVEAPGQMPQGMEQAPEGQMPPEGMPPQGGQDPQMEALMQEVASMMEQGADPATIIGGLLQSGIPPEIVMQIVIQTGIAPDEQTASQMIQETMASMQQGAEQQAPAPEGGQAPQGMMQPPMALGGETAMNDKIAYLAELTGTPVQELSDQIAAAIEQSGDASAVEAQLDQAIAQLEQQAQQPQGAGQGMPQGGGAPEEATMSPGMRYGGPTPKDFRELEREMINQYRKGGTSKGEFDTSNTQNYIENLKGAVSNWVTTNNKIGLVRQRTEKNLALFDELPESVAMLPKAAKGVEIKGVKYTHINDLNKAWDEGTITEAEYNKAIQDQKADPDLFEVVKPAATNNNTNTNTNTNTTVTDPNAGTVSSNAMQGETYAQWATRNKIAYGGQYSDAVWDGTKWVQPEGSGAKHYYPGYGPGTSLSGRNVPTNSLLQSIESLTGAIGPKTATGNLQIKGVEGLAGKSAEEVTKRFQEVLADPTKFQYAVKDVRRKNIFGKEKKGDRNIIGKQILWSPITGQPVSTNQPAGTTNTPAEHTWNPETKKWSFEAEHTWNPETKKWSFEEEPVETKKETNVPPKVDEAQMLKDLSSTDRWTRKKAEEYFANKDAKAKEKEANKGKFDGKAYSEFLDKEETLRNRAIQNLGEGASQNAIYDEMDRLEQQGIDSPYNVPPNKFTPVVDDLNRAYSITNPVTEEESWSGSPTMTNPNYFKPGNSAWQGKDYSQDEFWAMDMASSSNHTPDSQDPNVPKPFDYEGQVWSWDPAYKEYIKANPGAYNIKGRPELQFKMEDETGMRWYTNANTGRIETFNPTGSKGYDPASGFYARGGELTGGIIWDFHNKRFVRRPTLMTAAKGMETTDQFGMNILPEMSRDIQWGEMADSVFGIGRWANQKLDLMQKLTPTSVAAEERQAMFKPISAGYNSGQEGFYTQQGDFISQDVGAKMLPGTGTDQTVFTDGYQRNFYKDMNPGGAPIMTRNGGLYAGPLRYAQNGLEIDQEYDLSDDDIAQLEALGYKIERL